MMPTPGAAMSLNTGSVFENVAQASFWTNPAAMSIYDGILVKVAREKAQALPAWVLAGALGASRAARGHPSR